MIKVDGKEIRSFRFNGGEMHVEVQSEIGDGAKILAELYCSDDIMTLLMTVDAIRQIKVDVHIGLTIPYFPYARQDRVVNDGEALGVSVMARLINSLHVNMVKVFDPHSPEVENNLTGALTIVEVKDIFNATASFWATEDFVLVAPDTGAEKKVRALAEFTGREAVYCTKGRNRHTGEIIETRLPEIDPNKNYLIVDDICDGGRTFIELAKKFGEQRVYREKMQLYVTHGIFSGGFARLHDYFNQVYCWHAFPAVCAAPPNLLTILSKKEGTDEL